MLKTMRLLLPAALVLSLSVLLSSCGNCVSSGLCPVSYQSGTAVAGTETDQTLVLAPGASVRVKLKVELINLPKDTRLILGTMDEASKRLGPNVVASFDDGRVQVRWDGVPFTADQAFVTVVVDADATRTGTNLDASYTTSFQTFIKADTNTVRAGSVVVSILIN